MLRTLSLKRLRRGVPPAGSLQDAWAGLRCTTSSAAAEAAVATVPVAAPAGGGGGIGEAAATPDRVAKVIAHSFHRAPKETAAALLRELTELDRIHLVLALQRTSKVAQAAQKETAYVDDLMKQVARSHNTQHAKLTRQQIHNAVVYQRMLQKFAAVSEEPPSLRQLLAVGFASGLPFLAFGILDNGIMLLAGEQIDHLFGRSLGLTMMASAALGNLVADVVGVSATHSIQENIKRVPFAQPPRLSMLQQKMWRVSLFQMGGAAVMVAIGCLIGMTPLLLPDGPGIFCDRSADIAAAAAAASGMANDAAAAAAPAAAGAVAAVADGAGGGANTT